MVLIQGILLIWISGKLVNIEFQKVNCSEGFLELILSHLKIKTIAIRPILEIGFAFYVPG